MINHNFRWTLPIAVLLTLMVVVWQRVSGPTYPQKYKVEIQNETYSFKLPRSQENSSGARLRLSIPNQNVNGQLYYKRYPIQESWTILDFERIENELIAELPVQPAAGKLEYFIKLNDTQMEYGMGSEENPILIRFKGPVPSFVLTPHIVLMFLTFLLVIWSAFEAMFKTRVFIRLVQVSWVTYLFGGMILGPIVQKYAFGKFWAGFPIDSDLTDNKTLFAFTVWSLVLFFNLKVRRPFLIFIGALVVIFVFSIPHSLRGSQYNYQTMEVQTGD